MSSNSPYRSKRQRIATFAAVFSPTNRRGPWTAEIDQNVVARHFIEFDITDLLLKGSQAVFGRCIYAVAQRRDLELTPAAQRSTQTFRASLSASVFEKSSRTGKTTTS
jgi:hypothetical protein